ncbi:MAG TPA: hypothetical protein VGP99_05080 [Tepidisphaeraceae bacterium]|jgi:hypothetical protein|nr:hypothetical protein [Tepidisphaeraceae bacterium]
MKWLIAILAAALVICWPGWKLCCPGANAPTTTPSLLNQWEDQVYLLDTDEDVRFIPPPFSPKRPTRYIMPGLRWQQLMIRMSGQKVLFSGASSGKGTVLSAFSWCIYLTQAPDLELPGALAALPAEGDWIVREEAPLPRRMKALESILSAVTGRKLSIERPLVERDVIVARGKWDLQPTSNAIAAIFYVPIRDTQRGGMGTLADSFHSLGQVLRRKVIDETDEPRPNEVYWTSRNTMLFRQSDAWRTSFLAGLEKQTSLKFVQTRRVIPVWIVSEKGQQR